MASAATDGRGKDGACTATRADIRTSMGLESRFRGAVKTLESSGGEIMRRYLGLAHPAAAFEETAEDKLWMWTTTAAPVGLQL